jgi:hypothetical protein
METSAIIKPLSGIELIHLIYALVVGASFFGVSTLYFAVKLYRLNKLYQAFMQGTTGQSIEQMILGKIQDIEELQQSISTLQTECQRLNSASLKHIQRFGMIRFNAFDNTGSDLSFALAMTDASRNGFVLSGIYGRDESRVYAKPLVNGESTYALTNEERKAIENADKKS